MGPPLIFFFFLGAAINIASAIPGGRLPPSRAPVGYSPEHCIQMTPEREDEVNSIVAKLSEYLYNLASDYDDLDIRLVKVVVESHSEDEVEEKETQVQLVVNDCAFVDDVQKDGDRFDVQTEDETDDEEEVAQIEELISRQFADTLKAFYENQQQQQLQISSFNQADRRGPAYRELEGKPEIFWLNLDQSGLNKVSEYHTKYGNIPLLVYVTFDCDGKQHLYLN